jgi:hypothetical protein
MAVRLTAEGRDCCHDYAAGWELGKMRRMAAHTYDLLRCWLVGEWGRLSRLRCWLLEAE